MQFLIGNVRRRVVFSLAISALMGMGGAHFARGAQPGDDGPPPARAGDGSGDQPHQHPPRPPRLEDAVSDLNLDADTQAKVDALVADLAQKEKAARAEFLQKLEPLVSPEQLAKVKAAINHGGPPPRGGPAASNQSAPSQDVEHAAKGTVILQGGYETDPRDGGRPVVLVAAALNVPSEVFRKAFTGVTPAGPGAEPEDGQVRRNKQALMKDLSPYGVTDDRLNEVSNFYRYSKSRGQMWKITPAVVTAEFTNGAVSGFTIVNAGAGYSSPPTIVVAGFPGATGTTTLSFGTDFAKNGSLKTVTLDTPAK